LAGECAREYQIAIAKPATINGSPTKAATRIQVGRFGRAMVDGTAIG
jgi:hypothetical protein